ncbi:MAG TPA: MFS transporter [Gemmatimonadales bacterium]|nr:MFS transporter [Gemmatimonadales bacterium]
MSIASESQSAPTFGRTGPEQGRSEPAPSARAEPEPPAESVRSSHPLRNRRFLTWWVGASISLLGDQFYLVALPWVVLQITGSALAMGTVAMAAGIPRAVLMLLGGAVTDRSSPRRLLMVTAAARTIFVAAIGALLWLDQLQLWHLYALAFAFGTADAFALPSSGAMLRTLVAPEQLPAANSVWQSSAMLTAVLGPAPAGWIMKGLGAAWAFFLDAISFLFIIGALWKLPEPSGPRTQASAPKPKVWVSIREGLSYVGSDVALRSLMLLAAVLNFCMAGPLSIGLAYMARHRFSSPAAFGAWISSVAAGTLIGMLLAGILKSRKRGLLLLATSSFLGVATGCMGFMPGLLPVAALLLVMGSFSGFINVQLQAWFQQRVDRAFLGRVVSVSMLSAYGLMPLSMAAAGAAVGWSTRGMFAISGAAVLLVSMFGLFQKPVRGIQ